MDMIKVVILEDGTISIKTSDISETNHYSADDLLNMIEDLSGGTRQIERREHPLLKNKKVLRGGRIVQI